MLRVVATDRQSGSLLDWARNADCVRRVAEVHLAFWLPTRPYTLVGAINRCAAATGSVRYAQLASYANYNGHHVTVYRNDFRGYWLAEHHWGERVVHHRGTLRDCLAAAKREYDRGALGASASVHVESRADAEIVRAAGWLPCTEETKAEHHATFTDDRFALVGHALRDGSDYLLLRSRTAAEYHELVNERYFGPVLRTCTLVRGEEVVVFRVRAKTVSYTLGDGRTAGSGPAESMRQVWRELVAAGYVCADAP